MKILFTLLLLFVCVCVCVCVSECQHGYFTFAVLNEVEVERETLDFIPAGRGHSLNGQD